MEFLQHLKRSRTVPLCLVCGVDSVPVRNFMFIFIGSLVAASLSFLLWARITRRLGEDEKKATLVLEAEKRETPHE